MGLVEDCGELGPVIALAMGLLKEDVEVIVNELLNDTQVSKGV
jgi:hypothetical protein